MNHRTKTLMISLSFGLSLIVSQTSFAQTRIGLHVTQEELNIWKQRATSGPYKTVGDVSPNSPGDWTKIKSKADSFLSNPSQHRWQGQVAASCMNPGATALPEQNRALGEKLRDAAFVYLITGTTSYRDAVRTELLAQAAQVGTNWADRTRWCPSVLNDANPFFDITMWATKLLFGYSYIRNDISMTDRTTLDTWFRNGGVVWEGVVNKIAYLFVDRTGTNLALSSAGTNAGLSGRFTHYQGFAVPNIGLQYNNRKASIATFFGLAGILTNDTLLKTRAKRYVKEYLAYGIFPDGTPVEFERWDVNIPPLGWGYSGISLGYLVTLADHFARDNDLELYQFSTSLGSQGTAGGPKDLKKVIDHYLSYLNHKTLRYGTNQAANATNANYLIDSEYAPQSWFGNYDIGTTPANVYYQDTFAKSIYTRTAVGVPAYPANAAGGGYDPWGGPGGIYPGVLFMFGDMEAKVRPYPSGATGVPSPPINLTLTLE